LKARRSGAAFFKLATAESSSPQTITLWDSLSGSGTLLWRFYLVANHPLIIFFPPGQTLNFNTGLTVVTSQYAAAYLFTAV